MQTRPAAPGADADVVVIGGGVAGLSAATSLAERGARVVRAGGQAGAGRPDVVLRASPPREAAPTTGSTS